MPRFRVDIQRVQEEYFYVDAETKAEATIMAEDAVSRGELDFHSAQTDVTVYPGEGQDFMSLWTGDGWTTVGWDREAKERE